MPSYFKIQPNETVTRNITDLNCEIESVIYEEDLSKYPQTALSNFGSDQELLGCAITAQYHNNIHSRIGQKTVNEDGNTILGDMNNASAAPRDPLFWRLHKFIDNISVTRSLIEENKPAVVSANTNDTKAPLVSSQNPFYLSHNPFITGLPIISEGEKSLFGEAGMEAISIEFDESIYGINPGDLVVDGSPATHVNGKGAGPYVFIGFYLPQIGPVNVVLSPGNIKDSTGNQFEGSSWEYILVDPSLDNDKDGLQDGIEVDSLLTDPSDADTDDDNIPDGFEISSTTCLDPFQNDAHIMDITGEIVSEKGLDSDDDGLTNVQEFLNNTDPCPTLQSMQEDLEDKGNSVNGASNMTENTSSMPFALVIREKKYCRRA